MIAKTCVINLPLPKIIKEWLGLAWGERRLIVNRIAKVLTFIFFLFLFWLLKWRLCVGGNSMWRLNLNVYTHDLRSMAVRVWFELHWTDARSADLRIAFAHAYTHILALATYVRIVKQMQHASHLTFKRKVCLHVSCVAIVVFKRKIKRLWLKAKH